MRQFFTEDNDRLSMTRLLAFECVQAGLAIILLAGWHNSITMEILEAAGMLVVLGFTGKLVQKPFEGQKV